MPPRFRPTPRLRPPSPELHPRGRVRFRFAPFAGSKAVEDSRTPRPRGFRRAVNEVAAASWSAPVPWRFWMQDGFPTSPCSEPPWHSIDVPFNRRTLTHGNLVGAPNPAAALASKLGQNGF